LYHTCPGITIKNSGIAFVKMEKLLLIRNSIIWEKHGSSPSKIIDVVYALVRERKIPVTDQI
jgi:hypothetical protein